MTDPINYYKELIRIADTNSTISLEDALILRNAAFKLIPPPKPLYEKTTAIPNGGMHTMKVYK